MDLNVECNEMHGENVKIPTQNDQVEEESARMIQRCVNYKTLVEEQALIHILDYNVGLEGQESMKVRNYKAK